MQHHNKQTAQCSITTNRLRSVASQQTQTAQCSATEIELFILLFADDLTLLACAVIGLQNQLNALPAAAKRLGWTVNLDKSKVICAIMNLNKFGCFVAGMTRSFSMN